MQARLIRPFFIFLVCVLTIAASALFNHAWAQQVPVPPFQRWVTDQTGTLDSNTLSHLESELAALDERKGRAAGRTDDSFYGA